MLRIRIVLAGLVAVTVVVTAANIATSQTALAQTATADQAGRPLAGLRPPHEAKSHAGKTGVHARVAHKTNHKTAARMHAAKTRFAGRKHHRIAAQSNEPPAQTEPAPPPPNASSAANAPVPADTAPSAAAQAAPSAGEPSSNALTAGDQTVQITTQDQINDISRAADDSDHAAASAAVSDNTAPAAPTLLTAPMHEDANQHARQHESQPASTVGSVSWIAQVLAALGGAVAAGTVAWFLIGSGPVRTYG